MLSKMLAKHESHVLFHIIGYAVDIQILFFTNSFYLLHYKMAVIASEIMKDDGDFKIFWVYP